MAPARGAEAEGAREADGVPRDHQRGDPGGARTTPASSTPPWSTRRRPAASSTASTATRSRRCCGARSGPGLSAGRVQSAATRLVVDRERERLAFVSASLLGPDRTLAPRRAARPRPSTPRLARLNGKRVAVRARLRRPRRAEVGAVALDETAAEALAAAAARCRATSYHGHERRVEALHAPPGGAVHDLDAAAGGRAQAALLRPPDHERRAGAVRERLHHLYANRLVDAVAAGARTRRARQAAKLYGAETVPDKPRVYASKSKNAQEAHEAIRPAGDVFRTPAELSSVLRGNDCKLYDLIWKRTVASQMADAKGSTASVTIAARDRRWTAGGTAPSSRRAAPSSRSAASCRHTKRATTRSATSRQSAAEAKLPPLTEGQMLALQSRSRPRATRPAPPPRYTEASLVKTLEELGIGRPSTYASIISTIVDRGYVTPRGTALVPNWIAFSRGAPARGVLRRPGAVRLHGRAWKTTSTASPTARPTASSG